ncbi:hypothetical protein QBC41DRAFT_107049 [Cercophora samala]|uniref:Fe2OG dioxygenase domain-containing protein n=1 Tax=Cercophora samala TaxID=330535 RepID=A0AA40DC32_9PEZI|nr:hypothetical protein QBC41DRAFT_107049 [Cercophora samala]
MAKDKHPKKQNPSSTPAATTTTATKQTAPDWPVFKPPLPVVSLDFDSPIQDKVVVLRSFFPKNLCRDYVSFLRTLPLTTTPGKPKRGMAVRVNDRFQVEDPLFAERLWSETGLKEAVLDNPDMAHLWGGEVVGLNPNIRVYRYTPGQFFDAHYDDSNNLTLSTPENPSLPVKTTWTLLLYLTSSTDGCAGGETVFYPNDRQTKKEAIPISPETGMLLLHKHGDDCMLHEGKEVTAGEKWILRSDLCVRR